MPQISRLLIVLISFAAAASASARDKGEALRAINTITISHDVPMPKVIMLAGSAPHKAPESKLGVPAALRDEFALAIRKFGKFSVKEKGPADAELRLKVEAYGFDQRFFTPNVRPVLSVRAQLVTPDGAVVLKFGDAITEQSDDTPEIPRREVRKNPEVGADALLVAARLLAEKFIKKIEKERAVTQSKS